MRVRNAALATLLIGGVGLFLARALSRHDDAVVAVLREYAPFELMLAGQTRPPCASSSDSSSASTSSPAFREVQCAPYADLPRLLRYVNRSRDQLNADSIALARLDLIFAGKDTTLLDRAVARLAAGVEPDSAIDVVNDLSVAYAVRGITRQQPMDLFRALELTLQVIDAAPEYQSALHNRDKLLERLSLGEVKAAAARGLQELREESGEGALAAWSQAVLDRDSAAAVREFARANAVADSMVHGDATIQAAVNAIAGASGATTLRLAVGHGAYARGRAAFLRGEFAESAAHFDAATRQLAGSGDSFEWWARLGSAAVGVYDPRVADWRQLTDAVLLEADSARFPALHGRAHWIRGLPLARRGESEKALREYQAAIARYYTAGERPNLGAVQYLLAEVQLSLGMRDAAERTLIQAVAALTATPASPNRHDLLLFLGRYFLRNGLLRLSRATHEHGLEIAKQTGRSKDPAEVNIRLAQTAIARGDHDAAEQHLSQASGIYLTVTDSGMAARGTADVLDTNAGLLLATRPKAAIAGLTESLEYFRAQQNRSLTVRALTRRADAHRAAGDYQHTVADLRAALALTDQQLQQATTSAARAAVRESATAAFNRLIDALIELGDTAGAFVSVARARGYSLDDPSDSPERVAATLDEEQVLVRYAVLEDRVVMWIVTPRYLRMHEVRGPIRRLERRIDEFVDVLVRDERARAAQLGAELFADLLGNVPVLDHSRAVRLIVEVDGPIARLPFAALRVRAQGPYLVEIAQISIGRQHRRAAADTRARVLVANADFDRTLFPDLPVLRHAPREAANVAGLYSSTTLLEGAAVTPMALRRELSRSAVFHYAGHAWANAINPARSALIMMPDAEGLSTLTAEAVEQLDLSRLQLVVLSACSTAKRGTGSSADMRGLAHAFLGAGAHRVVASIWDVADDETATLLTRFHQQYLQSNGSDALRQAQLEMIRSTNAKLSAPRAWAGFQLYAG